MIGMTLADLPLVSIVIPCYNAEQWVRQAVESCLSQRYPNIEIIVVDDGSTDQSLSILRRYEPLIKLESGPNGGGNKARNRGFALSRGEYIQYLDADDYLEPDKIARQVQFLEETKADAVYGDFRSRQHLADTRYSYLDKIRISGAQPDIVASLLSFWIVNGGAVLYRRSVVRQVGGWDETLKAAQDTDFFTSVAISGATILYQPGSDFVYRRYGPVTVSSSNLQRWVTSMCLFLAKSEAGLANADRLSEPYKSALATGYFEIARACYSYDARRSFAVYASTLNELLDAIQTRAPHFDPGDETRVFKLLQRIFGFRPAAHALFRLRAAINIVRGTLKSTFALKIVLWMRGVKLEREHEKQSVAD